MRFNLVYLGPAQFAHYQRDWLLAIAYSLEDLGHVVTLTHNRLEPGVTNIVAGAHDLSNDQLRALPGSGIAYGAIVGEVIAGGKVNDRPLERTDLEGAYLPFLRGAAFVWDLLDTNLIELERFGLEPRFLAFGHQPRLEEIRHLEDGEKDLDLYFYGLHTGPRIELLDSLRGAGLTLASHDYSHHCPYFVRNSFIARAKIELVLRNPVGGRFHINPTRVAYLATNRCATVAEYTPHHGGALRFCEAVEGAELGGRCAELLSSGGHRQLAEERHARIREHPMKVSLERVLEESFPG